MDDDKEERKQLVKEIEKYKKELERIDIPIKDDDLIYNVNLKSEKYTSIYHRIDKIFSGNYLQFIKKVSNPYIKEIYVLLRKYQYYFTTLVLNNTTIFDFTKSSEHLIDNLNNYLSETNTLTLSIKILPKFKRSDIDFQILDELFECQFSITFNYFNNDINFLEYHKVTTEIKNIEIEKPLYTVLMNCVSNSLKSFMLSYHGNIFQGLNKFLVYFENYFPELYEEAKQIRKEKKDIWTQEEQNKFEEGYVKFKKIQNSKEKFAKLAEFIGTKSLAECIKRYKQLKQISIKDKIEDGVKVEKSNNVVNDKKVKKQSIIEDSKPAENFPESTLDLVDEIMNQFTTLYSDVKLETPEKKEIYTIHGKYDSEDFEDEESELDEQGKQEEEKNEIKKEKEDEIEEQNNNNEKNRHMKNPEKVNRKDTSESEYELKSVIEKACQIGNKVDPVYDNMIRNVIRNGNKLSIRLNDIKMENISLALIVHFIFFLKCGTCKQTGFQSTFIKINNKLNLYYCGTRCTICKNDIYMVFKAEYLHINNKTSGTIFYVNSEVIDILETGYEFSCSSCTSHYMQKVKRVGKTGQCSSCSKDNLFGYGSQELISSSINTNFLDDLVIHYFQKYTINEEAIEDNLKYIKNYDKIGLIGNPLPEKGTCKHFKESFRWFRFSCCLRRFPCPQCHDEVSDHASEQAKLVLCGFCSFEQSSVNTVCSKCGKGFTKEMSGKGFWEGGEGCRDQHLMSSKDKHKFTNSAKTISKKAKDKKQGK
jgi:uncharacterized CHY-type Zn-finger protein